MRRYQQDDTVQVIRGKDRGKRGQIRQVFVQRWGPRGGTGG